MARSEARLAVSIWSDSDFLALRPTAQRMFMFLLSQPDLAHDGVIALRERRWSKSAAKLTPAQVSADLEELQAARFVVIDEDAEELLIRSFIRRDKVYRQPNVLRAAQDHLEVVTSPLILAEIASELHRITDTEDLTEAPASIIAEMLASIAKAIGNPSPNPPGNPANTPSAGGSGGTPGERGVVTAVPQVSPYPVPRIPDAPAPRRPPPAAERARRAPATRGTRIPDDFAVTPDLVEWARQRCPDVDGRHETEKFINHWRAKTGKDATKLDWPATWRNWMLGAIERTPGGRAPSGAVAIRTTGHRPSTTDQRFAAAQALKAQFGDTA